MLRQPPRPKPFPPKPRRLPERKRMTIAVGILAADGVVIAADSQETVQNYWKGNQGKVWWSAYYGDSEKRNGRSAGVCAVACAGRAGYCDALTSRVIDVFKRTPDVVENEDVRALFEEETVKFHNVHVVPYIDPPEVPRGCPIVCWNSAAARLTSIV